MYEIDGQERISLSSTIAKCWSACWIEPRVASFFVTVWNALFPFPVNCMSTTGPWVGSMSARVPESFSSVPFMFGYGP